MLRREKVVAGGEQIMVYIGPLKPGKYEFFGDFNPTTARAKKIAQLLGWKLLMFVAL